jgi:hypothetical protein
LLTIDRGLRQGVKRDLARRAALADSVEKGLGSDAEISVIQSVQLAGLKIMSGHPDTSGTSFFPE